MLAGILAFFFQRPALIGLGLLALVAGVQSARLAHAKGDLAHERTASDALRGSLRASESSRTAEYAQATTVASDAERACADRVTAALRSGSAIRRIVERPPHVDPTTHCPLRELVPAGELRDAVQAIP